MIKADDFNQYDAAIKGAGRLRIGGRDTMRGPYREGEFVHPLGIVLVLTEGPTPSFKKGYTRLDAVVNGRHVWRTWQRQWTDRAIPRLARRLLGARC